MELAFMRFNGKPFGDSLGEIKIFFRRDALAQRLNNGENILRSKGTDLRTVTGKGRLSGLCAAQKAKNMRSMFSSGEKGVLVIPEYGSLYAMLRLLTFSADGDEAEAEYSFEFWEQPRENPAVPLVLRHVSREGDNLWTIARTYETSVEELLRLNPQIRRPDRLNTGEEVTVHWR